MHNIKICKNYLDFFEKIYKTFELMENYFEEIYLKFFELE